MRMRLTLLIATLAVAVVAVPSAASAATLYTTTAHTTAVAVGTTITASTPTGSGFTTWQLFEKAGNQIEGCNNESLSFKVTQNSGGVFKANLTGATFPLGSCAPAVQEAKSVVGELQVSASSVANGTNTAWLTTTLKEIFWTWPQQMANFSANFTSATGSPPSKGVFAQQPTAAKAPVSVILNKAGTVVGWGIEGSVSANYTLTGTSAAYSLG